MSLQLTNMKLFCGFCLLFFVSFCQAQSAHTDAVLRVNAIIAPHNSMEVKRKQLIVEGFREDKKVKTDKINYFDVDLESLSYSIEDGLVSMACHKDMGDCVERHLHIDGQKTYRKRVAFEVADAAKAEQLMAELRTLVHSLQHK